MKRKYKIGLVGSSAQVRIFTVKVGSTEIYYRQIKRSYKYVVVSNLSSQRVNIYFKQRKSKAKLHTRLCVTMQDKAKRGRERGREHVNKNNKRRFSPGVYIISHICAHIIEFFCQLSD